MSAPGAWMCELVPGLVAWRMPAALYCSMPCSIIKCRVKTASCCVGLEPSVLLLGAGYPVLFMLGREGFFGKLSPWASVLGHCIVDVLSKNVGDHASQYPTVVSSWSADS